MGVEHCHLLSPSAPGPSLTVSLFPLSLLCLLPSFSLCSPLALWPCPLPVFWPCSSPSMLGGVRLCAHGMFLHCALAYCLCLLPPFLLTPLVSPVHRLCPSCPPHCAPSPSELSLCFPSRFSQSFGTTQLRQAPAPTGLPGTQPSSLLGECWGGSGGLRCGGASPAPGSHSLWLPQSPTG